MDIALRVGYCIALFIALAAIILNIVLLFITIKVDEPRQQDDHDYSDLTKILGGTCNWDDEQDK